MPAFSEGLAAIKLSGEQAQADTDMSTSGSLVISPGSGAPARSPKGSRATEFRRRRLPMGLIDHEGRQVIPAVL
jgi:hypothetical protein